MANHSFSLLQALGSMVLKKTSKVTPAEKKRRGLISFCQLTMNEKVFCRFLQMLLTAATIEVSVVYLQCSLLW